MSGVVNRRRLSGDASVNSPNSPVTRNAVCSPMSTALSPIRSRQRATMIIRIPHSCASGSLHVPEHLVGTRRFVRSTARRARRAPRARSTSRSANASSATLTISSQRSPISTRPSTSSCCVLERGRELRQLRDRDALVADPLEVESRCRTASTSRRSPATGVWRASTTSTCFSMPVVALVDLVVERDHLVAELDVLRAERVDRAADRPEARSPPAPGGSPRARRARSWNSTPCIRTSPSRSPPCACRTGS